MKRNVLIITVLVLIFGFLITDVEAINLLIDEGKVRLSIPAGGTKSGEINVRNSASEPIAIRVYLEDWYYLPIADGSKEFIPKGTAPLSCGSWISFSPAEFTIPPFGKRIVN